MKSLMNSQQGFLMGRLYIINPSETLDATASERNLRGLTESLTRGSKVTLTSVIEMCGVKEGKAE